MDRSSRAPFAAPAPPDSASRLLTALACWFAAGCFLMAWWWPRLLDDGRWIKFGVAVLLFEFLTIHATAMLTFGLKSGGTRTRNWLWLVGLYAAMALAMALAFGSWVLLVSFGALLASRIRALLHPEDRAARVATHRRVAVSAALFIGLAFVTVFAPVPAGGIDASLLRAVWPDRGTGLWEQQPQRALAFGFVYFLLLGWVEARRPGPRWDRMPLSDGDAA